MKYLLPMVFAIPEKLNQYSESRNHFLKYYNRLVSLYDIYPDFSNESQYIFTKVSFLKFVISNI